MADHSRLGRGLAALMGDVGEETQGDASRKPRRAPIENLTRQSAQPAPQFHRQPNSTSSPPRSRSAASSSRSWCAPLRGKDEHFEIIAGERRWRAAQRAGLHQVPIAIVEATDAQALEFAIIENVQRSDLNPIEEAAGYLALMNEFNHGQDDVAQIVGKSRSHVANTLRLLKLSEPVQLLVQSGQLSAGHARQLRGTTQRARDRAGHHQARPERAADRNRDAQGRPRARRATSPAPRAPRTPTPKRWKRNCPTRSGWRWRSTIAPTAAARCASSIAIWISSMRC